MPPSPTSAGSMPLLLSPNPDNPNLSDVYKRQDERRDVMVCTYQYKWDADKKAHKLVENKKLTDWYPGKWRREWMPKGFVDPNNTGVNYRCV